MFGSTQMAQEKTLLIYKLVKTVELLRIILKSSLHLMFTKIHCSNNKTSPFINYGYYFHRIIKDIASKNIILIHNKYKKFK